MKYLIGIVTYNPELDRLRENLNAACSNTDAVMILLVDNASSNIDELRVLMSEYNKLQIKELDENKGVAYALNIIGTEAELMKCDWFMTLDQDSVLQPQIMNIFSEYIDRDDAAIIAPRIEDRNYGRQYAKNNYGVDLVDVCITSGNLVRTSIWRECGGYDDSMFIDGVDFDFCLSVKERNKKVIRINKAYLLQEVGQGYARKIAGKTVAILNHSYLRLYYISRNYLYLGKKHGQLIRWISPVLKRMLLVALYEQNKIIKIRYMLLGCWDFILGKMGKCRY